MSSGYSDGLLREARSPQGEGRRITAPSRRAAASNPLCGDEVELDVDLVGAMIVDLAHRARGCAFTRASASLLARALTGASLEEARALGDLVRRDLAGTGPLPAAVAALASVRVYPARTRCALLPWEALRTALA